MVSLLPIFIFLFGLLIGSFLNVVILRLNTGRSIAVGRSKCARCSQTLEWYELIPVFSFLGLRGKCRSCRAPISFQYPVIELVTGLLFIILYSKTILLHGLSLIPIVSFLGSATAASLLVVIMVYDVKHKIIPDKIVFPFILLGLLSIIWKAIMVPTFLVVPAILSGILLCAPFLFLWLFSKGRAMGFGDVKLALGMGWFLTIGASIALFFLAFWIGAVVGLLLMAVSKARMKSQIPFAPFLIIAFAIVSLWGVTISSLFPLWI